MEHNIYLLASDTHDAGREVIHSRDTGLRVRVIDLNTTPFRPSNSEIQLFGYAGDKLLGFETINVSPDDALDVLDAIKWYARYIDYPEMEILPEDPRVGQTVAINI